ncbi:hypothetical protein ANO11243_086270 [Dothideomycetidae sp. 11243]|nr:hypothetical protein ANO11243_086270 [fungal sp. No.11243]
MKPSSSTLFKSFASRIHPQVVLSKQESKQFLNALTTSFRQRLDAEYPPHSHTSVVESKATGPLTLTEKHVASVLTNPLFAHTKSDHSAGMPTAGSPAARHPMEIFETCVANGTASLMTAMQCLLAFRKSLRSKPPHERQKAEAHYQAGTKVLQWLWASNLARAEVFEFDEKLFKAVVYFLVREGRDAAVVNWIETASAESSTTDSAVSPKSTLLDWFVTCKSKSQRNSVQQALAAFLVVIKSATPHDMAYANLAGSHLVTLLQETGAQEPDRQLIVEFLETFSRWQRSDLGPLTVDVSRLRLRYIPFKSINSALRLAEELDLQQVKSEVDQYDEKLVQFLVSLSDAIQKVGTQEQATQFINLLEMVEKHEKSPAESLLSRATEGVSSMLLQKLDKIDFGPRQLAVPG